MARILIIVASSQVAGAQRNAARAAASRAARPGSAGNNGATPAHAPAADREAASNGTIANDAASGLGELFAPALRDVLRAGGHNVSWTTRAEWTASLSAPDEGESPEVIVVEAGRDLKDLKAAAGLCREVRGSAGGRAAALLAVLPAWRRNDRARAAALAALLEAGADDFLAGSASEAEIAARIGAMAQLVRTRGELEATREHLRLHLQTDELTRLLNRRFFFQAAHREYSRARRYDLELSCLMLDIDHFKRLNTSFGYECGDQALRAVAGILRDNTRDSDIVARFGEAKFVALLPETPIEGAIILRENVQRAIAEREFGWQGQVLPLSVSIGEAARQRNPSATSEARQAPENDDDAPSVAPSLREAVAGLLEEADSALFVAKRGVRYAPLPDTPAE